MKKISFQFHLVTISLLLVCACIIRLFLFSGFVLGDDPAYADFVSQIIQGPYPHIGIRSVFTCRPIVLYSIALPVYLFGWFDWSFVLPILLASLACTVIAYLAGNKLSGPLAGILAALAFMTFPLDAVHATTLSNDILLSAFIWGGALFLLFSYNNYDKKSYLLLSAVSGFIVGAAVAIKLNAVVAPAIFMMILFWVLLGRLRAGGYKTLTCWFVGWIAANIILCLFLYSKSGDFLAHYHAEMRFNLDYNPSGYFVGKGSLMRFLLYYPKLILGISKEGHQIYQFMPYGYFFLCFFLSLPLTFMNRFKKLRLPAFLALVYMIIMEFAPLKLTPDYVPIHRLPRFLHIASIPAAVAIGIAFTVLITMKNRAIKIFTWMGVIALVITSLYWSYIKSSFYKDCSYDQRWAWELVKDASAQKIVTDNEMRNYLMFRSGFQPSARIDNPKNMPKSVPLNSLVILGGARRPDVYPGFADNWYRRRQPDDWLLLSEAQFPLKPWRLSNLKIYQVQVTNGRKADQKAKMPSRRKYYQHHAGISAMKKLSELDVGNPASENKFNYQLTGLGWSGEREFSYPRGVLLEDDGKPHRGVETIMIRKLIPHKPLIIVKRLDPTVAHQKVKVHFNNNYIGIWPMSDEGLPGRWHEAAFKIPAKNVTDTTGELSFSFLESDFDVNSFYYWFFQP